MCDHAVPNKIFKIWRKYSKYSRLGERAGVKCVTMCASCGQDEKSAQAVLAAAIAADQTTLEKQRGSSAAPVAGDGRVSLDLNVPPKLLGASNNEGEGSLEISVEPVWWLVALSEVGAVSPTGKSFHFVPFVPLCVGAVWLQSGLGG